MTRASVREYAAVQRERYREAGSKKARGAIVSEVVAVEHIDRKAAIRLLRRGLAQTPFHRVRAAGVLPQFGARPGCRGR